MFTYPYIEKIQSLLNSNQGVLTLALFLLTLTLGWISGIFGALRRKPNFVVKLIPGPTFSCTLLTGNKHGEHDAHKTGVALYLHVSNTGSAPSSINSIEIGYHWHVRPFSRSWLRNRVGWFWLRHQTIALEDFQVRIGSSTKVFPFLTQINHLSSAATSTYLQVGESTNGVVYFEQSESWGGCFPSPSNDTTRIRIKIIDAHGRNHISTHTVPIISHEAALKYNPRFGETLSELGSDVLPNSEVIIPRPEENS